MKYTGQHAFLTCLPSLISLLTLSRVIVALGQPNQMHVNFRDSKLTRILQPSLSGNANMAVICCATPSELYLEETRSTLQFASRAKLVKTNAQVNEVLDDRSIIRKLQRELAEARRHNQGSGSQDLQELESKAANAGTAAIEAHAKLNRLKASILNTGLLFSSDIMKAIGSPKARKDDHENGSRKRRQSDIVLPLRELLSPQKNEKTVASPKTMPRKKKEKKSHPSLTPKSELSIIRTALNSRASMANKLKQSIVEKTQLLLQKEKVLEDMTNDSERLSENRAEDQVEINKLRRELAESRSHLQATITEYETVISEKENAISESSRQLEAASEHENDLSAENAKLNEELAALKINFDKIQQESLKSASHVEQLRTECNATMEAKALAEERVEELSSENSDIANEKKAIFESVFELKKELSEAEDAGAAAMKELASVNTQLLSVEERAKSISEQAEARNEALGAEKKELEEMVASLEERVGVAEAELFTIREQNSTYENQLNEYQLKCEGQKETILALNSEKDQKELDHEELRTKFTALEETQAQGGEKVVALALEKSKADHTIAELNSKLNELETRGDEMASTIATTNSTIEAQGGQLAELNQTLEAVRSERDSLLAEANEARVLQEGLEQDLLAARTQLGDNEKLLLDSHERVTVLNEKLDGLGTNNVSLGLVVGHLNQENEDIQKECNDLFEQLEEKELTIGSLNTEIEEQTRQLEAARLSTEEQLFVLQNALEEKNSNEKTMVNQLKAYQENILALDSEIGLLRNEVLSLREENQQHQLQTECMERENLDLVGRLSAAVAEGEKAVEDLHCREADWKALQASFQVELQSKHEELAGIESCLEVTQCQMSQLESEIMEYKAVVLDHREEKTKMSIKVSEMETEIATMSSESHELRTNLSSKQSEFVKLRTQLTSKEIEKSELHNEIGTLTLRLNDETAKHHSLLSELEMAKSQTRHLGTECDRMAAQIASYEEVANTEVVKLNGLLKAEIEGNEGLKNENIAMKNRLETLETRTAELMTQKKNLERAGNELATENTKTQDRIHQVMAEKDELDQFVAASEEELRSLKAMHREMQEALDEARENSDSVKEHARLDEENAELRKELQKLLHRANEFEIEKVEMESKLMSLEADKMKALARVDSNEVSNFDQIEQLEETIKELQRDIEVLNEEKKDLMTSMELKHSQIDESEKRAQIMGEESEGIQQRFEESLKEINDLRKQLDDLSSIENERVSIISTLEEKNNERKQRVFELEEILQEAQSDRTEMQRKFEQLQKAHRQLSQEAEQATNSKTNIMSLLKERESERDEAMNALLEIQGKNQDLSKQLKSSLSHDRAVELETELAEVKRSKIELNQLLVSTNESEQRLRDQANTLENELQAKERDLEDSQFRINQLEEELQQTEIAFEERLRDESHETRNINDASLANELDDLRTTLQQERSDREKAEASLKQQMADEQRLLVQEGEKMMEALRTKLFSLEKRLSESQDEAYTSRQSLEKLRDTKSKLEKQYAASSVTVQSIQQQTEEQTTRISELEKHLHKAKTDSYEAKETSIESKEKLRKAMREVEKANQDKEVLGSELSVLKRKISTLEKTNLEVSTEAENLKLRMREGDNSQEGVLQLSQEIENCKVELEKKSDEIVKLKSEILEQRNTPAMRTRSSAKPNRELENKVEQMKTQIKQKDQRIKKLEAVRLTKEQVESIKKLKSDNMNFTSKISKLSVENASLKSELRSSGDSALKTEVSALHFDKEALEKKLRKLGSHCQRLEGDRASLGDALRSCNIDPAKYEDNLNQAVISLCDRLASVEESSVPARGHEKELQTENKHLLAKLKESEAEEERLASRMKSYEKEVSKLQGTIKSLSETREVSAGENNEVSRKLRYLEQENLQLMLDVKTTKKQLHSAKEELEMLRMNNVDTTTLDFGSVDITSRGSGSSFGSGLTGSQSKGMKPGKTLERGDLDDSSNKENTANRRSKRLRTNSTFEKARAAASTPGLGQASVEGDDTAECKQS